MNDRRSGSRRTYKIKGSDGSEGRIVELGPAASASVADDQGATASRVQELSERLGYFIAECDDAESELGEARERYRRLEDHKTGWSLWVVAALGLVTVGLEFVPASLFTQIFVSLSDAVRQTLTITFTVVGALLAIFFGELMHRLREPARQHRRDTVLLAVVGIAALIYLYLGYKLRLAYSSAAETTLNIPPQIEALALVSIAFIGVLLTVVSTYYRESIESFLLRRKISRLKSELAESQAHRDAIERNLKRAKAPELVSEGGAPGQQGTPAQQPV